MKIFPVSLLILLVAMVAVWSCDSGPDVPENLRPREDMRTFIQEISAYAKQRSPGFHIIPQNGEALVSLSATDTSQPAAAYLAAIDGQGREDLWYGYDRDNKATDPDDRAGILPWLQFAAHHGVSVMVTDYCSDQDHVDDSYQQNQAEGFISFAADDRELRKVPDYPAQPFQENSQDVHSLRDAQNFLYLINPEQFGTKEAFLAALESSHYDLLLIDAFFDETWLTAADLSRLKTKPQGGRRLVISYMSIGEAEDYRYYWDPAWKQSPPSWMEAENSAWKGNYKVRYWDTDWKAIIFGSADAYLDHLLAAGFDGTYLDIVDAYEYFE